MWQKNNGKSETEIVQNRFTAYLATAVKRRRDDYLQQQDSALLCALKELSERERYIFLARALDGKGFEVLAEETGMGYKGVSAVYYRTVQKIKRKIEVKNEF